MPPDGYDVMWAQTEKMRRRLELLENNPAPTMPVYDSTNFPQDGVEGQHVSARDNSAWHFVNNAWHQIGGKTLEFAYAWYGSASLFPANNEIAFDLAGTIYTNTSGIFSLDTWTQAPVQIPTGHVGLGIHEAGTYWVHIGVQLFDNWASAADPHDSTFQIRNWGRTTELQSPSFGSYRTRGYHEMRSDGSFITAQAEFDASFDTMLTVTDTTTAPIVISGVHNAPVTMTAYPNILVFKLDDVELF